MPRPVSHRRFLRTGRPGPLRRLEKDVQEDIVQAFRTVGAQVWVLGRPGLKDRQCPTCHEKVRVEAGTRQTPGIPDLYIVLPAARYPGRGLFADTLYGPHALWFEVKRDGKSPRSKAQVAFADAVQGAVVPYVYGDLDVALDYLLARGYLREVAHYRITPNATTQA